MANLPLPKKRLSLAEQLSKIHTVGDDDSEALFHLMEELEQEDTSARGFRYASLSVQRRQDHHLSLYQNFIRTINKLPSTHPVHETNQLAFPADHQKFFKYIRFFLVFVATRAQPKGGRNYIEYSTLDQYRSSIMFWARRLYAEVGDAEPPPTTKMFNQMTEQMRSIWAKHTHGPRKRRRMPAIGLAELRQLIDYDVISAVCPENAEQHHLAWCIGRQSAIRAGSLCTLALDDSNSYLSWDQVELTKTTEAGKFRAVITITKLKTSRADPESGLHRDLVLYFDSPNAENVIFSVPHRLLVIAMRRGILEEDFQTIEDLLNFDRVHVTIKREHLKDPVFFGAAARGLDLTKTPMSTTALQSYLRTRCQALGYAEVVSFHAIRRQTATDLTRRVGAEATREIMAHNPNGRTLERYYVNALPTFDMSAASLNEMVHAGGQSEKKAAASAPLALTALDPERLQRLRGAALNRLVQTMIASDPEFPMESKAQNAYKKRARRLAAKSLAEEEHEAQKRSMTTNEAQKRIDMLEITNFTNRVRDRAIKYNRSALEPPQQTSHAHAHLVEDYDSDFEEPAEDDQAEMDVEDTEPDGTGTIIVHSHGEEFDAETTGAISGDANDVTYVDTVRSFMEIMQGHVLNQYRTWADRDADEKVCRLCRSDETVPAITRFKQYDTKQHLDAHETSAFHSPYKTWTRRMKMEHAKQAAEDRLWYCPYSHDSPKGYQTLEKMADHVQRSNAAKTSSEHEEGKRLDGWFEEDFAWISTARKKTWQSKQLKTLKQIGVKIPAPNPKQPIPHPTFLGIHSGVKDRAPVAPPPGMRLGSDISPEERARRAGGDPWVKELIAAGLITEHAKPDNGPDPLGYIPGRFKGILTIATTKKA